VRSTPLVCTVSILAHVYAKLSVFMMFLDWIAVVYCKTCIVEFLS